MRLACNPMRRAAEERVALKEQRSQPNEEYMKLAIALEEAQLRGNRDVGAAPCCVVRCDAT